MSTTARFKKEYTLKQVYEALLGAGFTKCTKNWASFAVFIYAPGDPEMHVLLETQLPPGSGNMVVKLHINNDSKKYIEELDCFERYESSEDE